MSQLDGRAFQDKKHALKSDAEIHIHVISPHMVDYPTSKHLLDQKEVDRGNSFAFDKDRNLYQASHVFLRRILSQYADIPPEYWAFSCNDFGKPAIENSGQESLSFNLSHTHSMIACAVGYQYDLGVDIEGNQAVSNLVDMCRITLSDAELTTVLSTLPKQREKLFYRYWTLKEAYIKALGKGLSIPMKKIKYEIKPNGTWSCSVDFTPDITGELYALHHNLPDNYSLALCANVVEATDLPTIRLFNWNEDNNSKCLKFNVIPKHQC